MLLNAVRFFRETYLVEMADWRRAAFGEPPPLFPVAASMMAAQQGMMQVLAHLNDSMAEDIAQPGSDTALILLMPGWAGILE